MATLVEEETERAVLAAILLDKAHHVVVDELPDDAFAAPRNRAIFRAFRELREADEPIDLRTVQAKLGQLGEWDKVGPAYLVGLDVDLPAIGHLPAYVAILLERRLRRQARTVLEKGFTELARSEKPAQELVREYRSLLLDYELQAASPGFTPWSEVAAELADTIQNRRPGDVVGLASGLRGLDRITGGFRNGQVVYIGARPSIGKSALAGQIAWHAAKAGRTVAFFSLEMGDQELGLRMMASETRLKFRDADRGFLAESSRVYFADRAKALSGLPLYFNDEGGLTVGQVGAACRRLRESRGLDMVVIDYIQLVESEKKRSNREQEVADVSRGLKALARDLEVPVLALSQFSRDAVKEKREPKLHDFRDSGSQEQDADVAIAIHGTAGEAQRKLIVLKNRNGALGAVDLYFSGETVTFSELDVREAPDNQKQLGEEGWK